MQFREWYYLQEEIDADAKRIIVSTLTKKYQDTQMDRALALLQNYEDEKTSYGMKDIATISREISKAVDAEFPKVEKSLEEKLRKFPVAKDAERAAFAYYQEKDDASLKEMMGLLRKFLDKKLIQLEIGAGGEPILKTLDDAGVYKAANTPDFTRFMSILHGIESKITGLDKSSKNYFDPRQEHVPGNLVTKGENIWVYKGSKPDVCRVLGREQRWCISSTSSASHWFDYRLEHRQTQYFIFDYNFPEGHPARYVNPGIAPDGEYSEWVDARNQHQQDPEEPNSDFGIEGFTSIEQYKNYLQSKGVDVFKLVAEPLKDWEKRLNYYVREKDFKGAKSDEKIDFDLYLKVAEDITDNEFDTLNLEQKKVYSIGRAKLTVKQFDFMLQNYKREYHDSLDLEGKLIFYARTEDYDKIKKLIENNKVSDDSVSDLLKYSPDRQKMAKWIILNKPDLSDSNVFYLITYATDNQEIAKLIIQYKSDLSDDNVRNLLDVANGQEIARLIIDKKDNLNDDNIERLLSTRNNRDEIAKLIIKKKRELSENDVYQLLRDARNEQEIADLLGSENINKLGNDAINNLISFAGYKLGIAEIIWQYYNHDNLSSKVKRILNKILTMTEMRS